tara:strand:+ start:14799 stop:15041 length:243 start_codon:yes stop_codon:yes gene_type:complete
MNLSVLEEQLQSDKTGEFRDKTLAQLEKANTALEAKITEGLFVEEFEIAKSLSEALESAQAIVKFAWNGFQETATTQENN